MRLPSDTRSRIATAGAFGLAALLVGFVMITLLDHRHVASNPVALTSALAFAIPGFLSGALLAPLVTNRGTGLQATIAGIGVTATAAFLFGVEMSLFGSFVGLSIGVSFVGMFRVVAISSAVAVLLGALTGWSVWRRIRRVS